MQRLEVNGAVRQLQGSLGVKGLNKSCMYVKSLSKSHPTPSLQKVCCEEQLRKTEQKLIQILC